MSFQERVKKELATAKQWIKTHPITTIATAFSVVVFMIFLLASTQALGFAIKIWNGDITSHLTEQQLTGFCFMLLAVCGFLTGYIVYNILTKVAVVAQEREDKKLLVHAQKKEEET